MSKVQEVDRKITQIKIDIVDYGKGLGKSVANAAIDTVNIGNVSIDDAGRLHYNYNRYEPNNEVQAMAMDSGDKLILLSGGLVRGVPANVAMAEGEEAAVVAAGANKLSPKVQNIMNEIDKQGIKVTVNPKKPETSQDRAIALQRSPSHNFTGSSLNG
jgi:S-adenosylhomocysteine hydrolase